jgi:hypothetical protein
MTREELIIALVRIAGSLLVLRWAFVGGIIAVLTDLSDLFLMNLLDLGGVRDYQSFDKYLDLVYMVAFLIVALRWAPVPRNIAIALFAYRMVGFVTFEITHSRDVLMFFPNVFEFWFLFVASLPHWRPGYRFTRRNVSLALALLTAVKLGQEYVLHVGRLLDGFTAVEAVKAIWHWVISACSNALGALSPY